MTHEAVHSWIEYTIEKTGTKKEETQGIKNNEEILANNLVVSYTGDPNSRFSRTNNNILDYCKRHGYFCSQNPQLTLEDFYNIDLTEVVSIFSQ